MSAPTEAQIEAGARFLAELLSGDPARLDVATDEQVVAMMDAAGVEAGEPESAEQALARAQRRARERHAARVSPQVAPVAAVMPRRSRTRAAWVVGAVAAAAAAALVTTELAPIAHRSPGDIRPDHPGPGPSPQEQARWLRTDALAALAVGDQDKARAKLDEAKALDPAGENDPKIVEARKALEPEVEPVPSIGPKEIVPR